MCLSRCDESVVTSCRAKGLVERVALLLILWPPPVSLACVRRLRRVKQGCYRGVQREQPDGADVQRGSSE